MNVPRLSELNFADGANLPLNVCVVSSEFLGPVRNGGIATATSGLLNQLASDGHRVTLLYTLVEQGKPNTLVDHGKPSAGEKSWQHWVDTLKADGIVAEHIPHDGDYRSWRQKSWLVMEFIRQRDFGVVYFNDHHGSGYYSLAAKRAGIAPFSNQLHCVITHGAMEWIFAINDQYARRPEDIDMMGLERRSVEWADVVIGPSSFLLREYESYGWRLPERTFCQPYPLFRAAFEASDTGLRPIEEIVFFGRLEVRKGLWLFCEALDRLAERLRGKTVTFLGRTTDVCGVSSGVQIVSRSSRWPCRVKLLTDYDQEQALAYLKGPNKLAVMPSLADNSPCVVYECMEGAIPFITTFEGGAEELVHPSVWPEIMVEPRVDALTEKLTHILDNGATLGRPRFDPRKNLQTWSSWHRHIAANRAKLTSVMSVSPTVLHPVATKTQIKTPLLLVLDSGDCALSLLIENLSSHVRRFGRLATYLVLSSRRGAIQEALSAMFNGEDDLSGTPVSVFGPEAIDEALESIRRTRFVFFLDAEVELLTPFFVLALGALNEQQFAAVSCVTAVRHDREENAKIEELPTGDIPGLSGLGVPIGSAAWAVSVEKVTDELASLTLYDKQLDAVAISSSLGQLVLHQCRIANKPVHLLPFVGAIETRESEQSQLRHGQFREAGKLADALGIATSVHQSGAGWLAISAFGAHRHQTGQNPIEYSATLPNDHPLVALQASIDGGDLAELASAFGRAELALQIGAGAGATAERVRHLVDIAAKSIRMRCTIELGDLLQKGKITEFGRKGTPGAVRGNGDLGLSRITAMPGRRRTRDLSATDPSAFSFATANHLPDETQNRPRGSGIRVQVCVDALCLGIRGNRILVTKDLLEDRPGRLLFLDVPLCGHSLLIAKMRAGVLEGISMRLKAIDQRSGGELCSPILNLVASKSSEFSVPLYEIYGLTTVCLEITGSRNTEVIIEALRIT